MTRFDSINRGGTVVAGSDVVRCDIGIRFGRIAALGEDLGPADEVFDARAMIVVDRGKLLADKGEGTFLARTSRVGAA